MGEMKFCPDCKVRLMRGRDAALCEGCGKFFDLKAMRSKRRPLIARAIRFCVVALFGLTAAWYIAC